MLKAFINRHYKLLETLEILLVVFLIYGLPVIYFLGGRCSVCFSRDHIIHDFREQIKNLPYGIDYDKMISVYGTDYTLESTREVYENGKVSYRINAEYETMIFYFAGDDPDDPAAWDMYAITVKDKSIRFNNNIHVGVHKWWVKWMFRHQIKDSDDPNAYWDGVYNIVEFSYDEHDRVSGITYHSYSW